MPKVKICGITRIEDVSYVNKYLPEYVGLVFAESRRRVTPEQAKALEQGLDIRIKRVGVFVNEDLDTVINISDHCKLDVIQIHGDESPGYVIELKKRLKDGLDKTQGATKSIEVWKAIRVKDSGSINSMGSFEADAFVLDAYIKEAYGGGGRTFDWSLAKEAARLGKIVLAGGLDRFNAWNAMKLLNPFSLDVSSSVETGGYKDESKIRDFINCVRSYG